MATISNGAQAKLRQTAHREGVITNQRVIKQFQHWKIFPFKIQNGGVLLTETGYKPSDAKITDYGKAIELFNSGVVEVIWQDSTIVYQADKSLPDQFYTNDYKVGKYWDAVIIQDESGVDFSNMNLTVDFKTMETKRNYTLMMSEDFLTPDDYLQFFVIFNDSGENIGGGTSTQKGSPIDTNQDRQWLYISNVINYYSPYIPDKIAYQLITFSSVNDRLDNTGQNITTFIQTAKPGDGYAFPTITNGVVGVDEQLIREIGVKYMGINTQAVMALSSVYCYGHPVIQGNSPTKMVNEAGETIYRKKIYAPRIIFAGGNNVFASGGNTTNGGVLSGITDPLAINTHPTTVMYNVVDMKPTGYIETKTWRDWMKQQAYDTDPMAERNFKGTIAFNKTETFATNGSSSATSRFATTTKLFYDATWFLNTNGSWSAYEVNNSLFFNYKGKDNIIINDGQSFTFPTNVKMSEVLAYNAMLNQPYIMLPFALDQFLPFQINTIPLIGKFLNVITFGLDPQFVIQQETENLFQKINAFSSKQLIDFISTDMAAPTSPELGTAQVPLNLYSNSNKNQIGALLGANVDTMAMTIKLTDRITCAWWNYETKEKGGTDNISTVDFLQKINRGGVDRVYIANNELVLNDIETPFTWPDTDMQWNPTPNGLSDTSYYGYVIDSIVVQGIYEGNYRLSFYQDTPFANTSLPYDLMVWQAYIMSASGMSGNLFNWTTFYKCGVDITDLAEQTTFSYPANILPPIPQNIAQNIEITYQNLDINYNVDVDMSKLAINWNTSPNTPNYNKDRFFDNQNDYKPKTVKIGSIPWTSFDPSLNIKNLQDLKKFYSKIRVQTVTEHTVRYENLSVNLLPQPTDQYLPNVSEWQAKGTPAFQLKEGDNDYKEYIVNFIKDLDINNLIAQNVTEMQYNNYFSNNDKIMWDNQGNVSNALNAGICSYTPNFGTFNSNVINVFTETQEQTFKNTSTEQASGTINTTPFQNGLYIWVSFTNVGLDIYTSYLPFSNQVINFVSNDELLTLDFGSWGFVYSNDFGGDELKITLIAK